MLDHDAPARIDLAEQLDQALDRDPLQRTGDASGAAPVLRLPDADPMAGFVSLATEIREVLHRPVLSATERARIHDRALDLPAARRHAGLRLAWPQLGQRGLRPAVIGGAAAAVLAVVGVAGVAALQRRGHGAPGVLQAA